MRNLLFLIGLVAYGPVYSSPGSIEEIFDRAEKYTLEIETEIRYPFIDEQVGSYTGTGFLIDKQSGWFVTNAHVVSRSPSNIRAKFKDNQFRDVEKVYIDPVIDLAILKIDREHIPDNGLEAKLDCVTDLKTGHPVGTYGHPWQVSFTATRGIVSGMTYLNDETWVQVDAPINHGNSGGPLISLETGLVVGINTAAGDDTEGLNFALPIKYACTIVDLLKAGKNPSPPDLNITFFRNDEDKQLKVAYVYTDNSDFHTGDVLVSVSDTPINHKMDLIDALRGRENVNVVVKRNGSEESFNLEVTPSRYIIGSKGIYLSGLLLRPNELRDRNQMDLENTWVVNYVTAGTAAATNAIGVWEFISTIDDQYFTDVHSLHDYLLSIKSRNNVNLVIKTISDIQTSYYEYYDVDLSLDEIKLLEIQ